MVLRLALPAAGARDMLEFLARFVLASKYAFAPLQGSRVYSVHVA